MENRKMKYLITGATGNVGSLVVERLLARGDRPRVFVRDAEKARKQYGDRVDVAVGDLAEPATLLRALEGVDALYLVSVGHELDVLDAAAAKVALTAGVKHLVKLSSIDAREQNVGTGVWHAKGEAAIAASGINFTFVQPSGFMVNALWWAKAIKAEGVLRSSTGDGKIPFIHTDDIADVSVKALTTRDHDRESLPLTGPAALSYPEMAAKIGNAIGKPIRYELVSDDESRKQQIAWDAAAPLVEARLSIFRAIREGRLAATTDTVERLLGRAPISFDRWAEQNAAAFR
jgi:uncharacterized protein YbjT (DUF2867 family)